MAMSYYFAIGCLWINEISAPVYKLKVHAIAMERYSAWCIYFFFLHKLNKHYRNRQRIKRKWKNFRQLNFIKKKKRTYTRRVIINKDKKFQRNNVYNWKRIFLFVYKHWKKLKIRSSKFLKRFYIIFF